MKPPEKILVLVTGFILLAVTVASCGPGAALDPIDQTLTPMTESVKATITARAGSSGNEDVLAQAIATATAEAQIVYGTQTAVAALNEPARLATATAIAPVVAELPRYGIDPGEGYVAWLHPPVTIEISGYQQTQFKNDYQNITASNFVMAADITWHTVVSTSGCGFMFRSNGNTNKPSQYIVLISRLATGQMGFIGMVNGDMTNFHTFYPKSEDKSFSWFNDATNRLAIVVNGNFVDMYTNGVHIGQVDLTKPPDNTIGSLPSMLPLPANATDKQKQDYDNMMAQQNQWMTFLTSQLSTAKMNSSKAGPPLTDGFLGFIAMNQSGSMSCKFENSWLFQLING